MDMRYPLSRGFPGGRAVIDQQTIHIHDITAEIETEFPEAPFLHQQSGSRTILATPLLREGVAIGAIVIRRTEVRPFSEKQIALLKTFASQAVIAIENVRLFKELQERNRQITEALEQQTVTSEILRVIAARRRTCSRCWMWLQKMRLGCVTRLTPKLFALMVISFVA
jgi:GAF domain-containing protein